MAAALSLSCYFLLTTLPAPTILRDATLEMEHLTRAQAALLTPNALLNVVIQVTTTAWPPTALLTAKLDPLTIQALQAFKAGLSHSL